MSCAKGERDMAGMEGSARAWEGAGSDIGGWGVNVMGSWVSFDSERWMATWRGPGQSVERER